MQHRCRISLSNPVLAIALLLAVCTAGCSRESNAPTDSETSSTAAQTTDEFILYHGGDIVTMEDDPANVEAVVTNKAGTIEFVGTWAAALKAYPQAAAFNLKGNTLMPGFIEQHLHPFLGALTLSITVIAPESWELPDKTWPAVVGQENYLKALGADFIFSCITSSVTSGLGSI